MNEIKQKLPYKIQPQTLASQNQLCINEEIRSDLEGHMLSRRCAKLRTSKTLEDSDDDELFQDSEAQGCATGCSKKKRVLRPNLINEKKSACPYFIGEMKQMTSMPAAKLKKFNPLFDMMD